MITLPSDSTLPLTDQIVQAIRTAIARGQVRPGDELPPIRRLASEFGVNLNTVARAYRVLEGNGLVSAVPGRGTRVESARDKGGSAPQRRRRIVTALDAILADAKLGGLTRREAQQLVSKRLGIFWSAR